MLILYILWNLKSACAFNYHSKKLELIFLKLKYMMLFYYLTTSLEEHFQTTNRIERVWLNTVNRLVGCRDYNAK